MARILIYDIETTPNLAYVWGKYQQDVIQYENEWELLCFAWKFLGDKKVQSIGRNTHDEETLVRKLHKLFNEADIVIAHNGDKFDQPMSNAKFIQFGLEPPTSYKSVDTRKVSARTFRFNSNKLDDLGNILGLGRKVQTGGFSLWMGCMQGDSKAWKKMLRYNEQDVRLLEKVYLKLRPWIQNHPGINIIDNRPAACTKCGAEGKMISRGKRVTKVNVYREFRCGVCGGTNYQRYAEQQVEKMQFTN